MHARLTFSLFAALTLADAQGPTPRTLAPVPTYSAVGPRLSAADVAQLETKLAMAPKDTASRLQLLRHYQIDWVTQTSANPATRAARLRHILYLIENMPAEPALAGPSAYVPSQQGPYADAGDHELIRNAWHRAVSSCPTQPDVQLQAAQFLFREHSEEAETLLSRAVDQAPSHRKLAATLGFFYAVDILRPFSTMGANNSSPAPESERLALRAKQELDRSNHPLVLAAAGTALPNLFMRTEGARTPDPNRSAFEYSAALLSRARQLAPQDAELKGPMPLVQEFGEFNQKSNVLLFAQTRSFRIDQFTPLGSTMQMQGSPLVGVLGGVISTSPDSNTPPPPPPGPVPPFPKEIRVGGNVQAAKLITKSEPVYPPLAIQARIQGVVRLNVSIAADGKVENITLISGHPLLQQAALQAVRAYEYQPTLLNGVPVAVMTQVDVPFMLPQ